MHSVPGFDLDTMRANQLICALLFLFALTACGQKGDLYLEKRALEKSVQEGNPTEESTESTRQRENSEREQADK